MFLTGIIAACGVLFLLLKFGYNRIVKHDILVDVCATFFLIWIFAGTFSGMMAGLIGGAIISAFLLIIFPFFVNSPINNLSLFGGSFLDNLTISFAVGYFVPNKFLNLNDIALPALSDIC